MNRFNATRRFGLLGPPSSSIPYTPTNPVQNQQCGSNHFISKPQHTQGENQDPQYNTKKTNTITLDGDTLEQVETLTYPVNIINEQGISDAHVKERIGIAKTTIL
ncbi:unnamed protein product [Schistosoma curassoni]|uniref:Uncharacterized protein n=1 Tax=Schistosoma curassoni TaxID=6186 RepID=A0A183K2D7_9TREM|nr:unnamed protein product [Schistosoma curassoni]